MAGLLTRRTKILKMNKRILLFALIAFLSTGIHAQIKFETGTLAAALEKAKQENKPLFVDVHAVWCGPCKRMAATAFTDTKVADFYNANFISLKLDGEKNDGPSVMAKYGITAYPTLLYFNADGSLAKTVVGGQDVPQLLKHANAVAKPESSPSFTAKKAYHTSKKSQADLKKLIVGLSEAEDDSTNYYTQVYYEKYPKLDINDKAELEVFLRNEADPNKPVSKQYLDSFEKADKAQYIQKLNTFIQQSYTKALMANDFSIVEKDVRMVYPYMQKADPNVPEVETFIEYVRSEFTKPK